MPTQRLRCTHRLSFRLSPWIAALILANPISCSDTSAPISDQSKFGEKASSLQNDPHPPATHAASQVAALPHSPRHPLADIGLIMEADVAAMRHQYDPYRGPRQIISLANTVVYAGAAPQGSEFSQVGGPMPDGSFIEITGLPRYSLGSRYIFFFSNVPWQFTPVWAGLAFRIEKFPNKTIVLGTNGRPVVKFAASGVRFGADRKSVV